MQITCYDAGTENMCAVMYLKQNLWSGPSVE